MKRFLVLLIAVVALACTPTVPVDIPPKESIKLYVYDSSWKLKEVADALPASRAAEAPATLQTYVDNYNATHTDDQLFIKEGAVPIEQAPTCELWIVDKDNYEPKMTTDAYGNPMAYHLTGVARSEVVDRREAWRLECIGVGNGLLFVDKAPPAPIPPPPPPPPDTRPDYVKYALYMIDPDADGDAKVESIADIVLEDHCENIGGYETKKAYFEATKRNYELDLAAAAFPPDHIVVSGRLYPAQ